jgi:chitin synthase
VDHSLKYVKSAKASTDVPTTVPEFISQRRRWLNGSLFASIHATVFWFKIWTSGQNFFRKIVLQFEFIYNAAQLIFTWTSLANFYLAFFFVRSPSLMELCLHLNSWYHQQRKKGEMMRSTS